MKRLPTWLLVVLALLSIASYASAADKQTCVDAYDEGQKQRAAGSLKTALELFKVCAEVGCPAATTTDCTQWVVEVEASMPTVVFAASDADGRDLSDVTVMVGNDKLATKLDGKSVSVDPGKRIFRFEREGASPIEQEVVIKQGEKNRKVAVSWKQDGGGTDGPTEGREVRISPGTWVLGGIGVAGLTVFGILGGLALSEKSDAEDTCAPNCADSVVDSIRAKLIVADVSLAVGVASLGAAVVLGVMSALDSQEEPSSKAAVRLDLAPVEGGAIGVVSGTF
ncbi:MAG: hypothetical protein HOV80_37800 [Polyangiaceae bacterium]|nr:hypothetical protein [Polyangiaceae bacterium]